MADRRTSIITATNELFRTHGYHGTSVSQISEASGATIGSIYHSFPGGKQQLTVAVIESTAAVYRELFETIVADASDPVAAYVDFYHGAADVLVASDYLDPCPIGTVAREVASTSEPLRVAAAAAFDSWVDSATDHLTGAGVAADEARRLALVFVMTVEGGFVLSRTLRSPEPLRAAAATFAPLVSLAAERVSVEPR